MKRVAILPIVLVLTVSAALLVSSHHARPAAAAPAWGGNCLACHDQPYSGTLTLYNHDYIGDPDESLTGAPDRGPAPVYRVWPGQSRFLRVQLAGLSNNDRYAVELTRLRFAGVEQGGFLDYTPDCNWPGWGDTAQYFTEPYVTYKWGSDPTDFGFEIFVTPYANIDFYNLLFAVAGKYNGTTDLYYDQAHFYLEVATPLAGDCNCDCRVDFSDIEYFVNALSGEQAWIDYYRSRMGEPPPCPYTNCDVNGTPPVGFDDIVALIEALGTGCK
jgi:hypothetical protein